MLSPGQSEALSELRQIVGINEGRLKLGEVRDLSRAGGLLEVGLSIDCRGETTPSSVVALQDREDVIVAVPARYPFEHPYVWVAHDRFAGLPHVIWVNDICLFLAENDWEPGRRMHGFVEQLLTWFEAVAHGTIVGPDIPWHAPLTGRQTAECLVVRPDLPVRLEGDADLWLALAVIERRLDLLYELREWLTDPAETAQLYGRYDRRSRKVTQGPCFVAPVVALPRPVGFSYPRDRAELVETLVGQGLSPARFAAFCDAAQAYNADPRGPGIRVPEILLLGSPAPEHYAIPSRIAHLAAWSLGGHDPDAVAWLKIFDQRPRITTRRDTTRPAQWLAGRRVLVLGCGALGAPAAEFCVRAGAAETHVVDNGAVRPGILVRQPYTSLTSGRARRKRSPCGCAISRRRAWCKRGR
jgi:Prokaryotic E2 family A